MIASALHNMAATDSRAAARIGLSVFYHAVVLFWTRFAVAPAKPGSARAIRTLPLLPVLFLLAFLFDGSVQEEAVLCLINAVNALWLIPLKLAALAMNRGQLVKSYDCRDNVAFALGLLAPVVVAFEEKEAEKCTTRDQKHQSGYTDVSFTVGRFERKPFLIEILRIMMHLGVKLLVVILMKRGSDLFEQSGNLFGQNACLGWAFYASTAFIQELYSLLILSTLNLKIAPSFDSPFISQSIRELCGRRYNVALGEPLRDLLYDPICEGCWVRGALYRRQSRPSFLRETFALLATFAFSGIGHSYMLWIVVPKSRIPAKFGLFFFVCGLFSVAENAFKHLAKSVESSSRVDAFLPWWARVLYVHGVILCLAHLLFWPDMHHLNYGAGVANGLLFMLGLLD